MRGRPRSPCPLNNHLFADQQKNVRTPQVTEARRLPAFCKSKAVLHREVLRALYITAPRRRGGQSNQTDTTIVHVPAALVATRTRRRAALAAISPLAAPSTSGAEMVTPRATRAPPLERPSPLMT